MDKTDATDGPQQRVDKTVSVKLTAQELAEFDAAIACLGLKRNRALRIAARRIAGFIEADRDSLALLKSINTQITGIARNINQIAKAANRTHDPDYRAFTDERRDLGKQLSKMDALLLHYSNTAKLRSDGLRRFKAAQIS